MKKIVIAPYSKKLRNGKENPKNYPKWQNLINLLSKDYHIIQLAMRGDYIFKNVEEKYELRDKQIKELIDECEFWISVDTFLQHLVNSYNKKPGVVLWSQSDPEIFGYKYNINILKDRKYLRKNQYNIWEQSEYVADAYMKSIEIVEKIKEKYD